MNHTPEKQTSSGRRILTAVLLCVLQCLFLTGILWLYAQKNVITFPYGEAIMVLLLVLCVLSIGSVMFGFLRAMRDRAAIERSLAQVETLNHTLRMQRHDFLNHLQVVHGLMELGEYDEADRYLSMVYGDVQRISRVLKTAHPAINALLQAKSAACAEQGIDFEVEFTTSLAEIPGQAWEICRVLGNLIDNAIDALEGAPQPRLLLRAVEGIAAYQIVVANNGPSIPEHVKKNMFAPGVSTKGEGRGMGLAIVLSVMEGFGGEISVSEEAGWTRFILTLPRRRNEEMTIKTAK